MKRTEKLVDALINLPLKFDILTEMLKKNNYTVEELTTAACEYIFECRDERRYFELDNRRKPKDDELHVTYLCEVFSLLLKYGLDINYFTKEDGNVQNIVIETFRNLRENDITINAIRLLLENRKEHPCNTEVFESIYTMFFDHLIEAGYSELTETRFKIWIMMIGYGGKLKNGEMPVNLINGFNFIQFRKCENFKFKVEILSNKEFALQIIKSDSEEIVATVIPKRSEWMSFNYKFNSHTLDKLKN